MGYRADIIVALACYFMNEKPYTTAELTRLLEGRIGRELEIHEVSAIQYAYEINRGLVPYPKVIKC